MMRFGNVFGYGIYNRFCYGMFGGGRIFVLLIGLLLIGLIVYILVNSKKREKPKYSHNVSEALQLLDLRFAKGEINEEEYRTRKEALIK